MFVCMYFAVSILLKKHMISWSTPQVHRILYDCYLLINRIYLIFFKQF